MFEIGHTYDLEVLPETLDTTTLDIANLPVLTDSKKLLDYALNSSVDDIDFELHKKNLSTKTLAYMLSTSLQRLQIMNRLAENLNTLEDRMMEEASKSDIHPGTLLNIHQKLLERLEKEIASYHSPENPTINFFTMLENKTLNITQPGFSAMLSANKEEMDKAQNITVEGRKKINIIMDSIKNRI